MLLPQCQSDLIILAGDIHTGTEGIYWAAKQSELLGKPVVYIAGNHEFYSNPISHYDRMRLLAQDLGVIFLENDEWIKSGVRFLGCTLWSDYRAAGSQIQAMREAKSSITDHRAIFTHSEASADDTQRKNWALFTPGDALERHNHSRRWLETKLAEPFDGKTVVITHHAPHPLCQHPSFAISPLSGAFWSDLSDLIAQADLWCYGHSHANVRFEIEGCRVITNQKGYPREAIDGFDPSWVFEV